MGRDRREGVVHLLLFLAHVVSKLPAAVDKHDAIIVPVRLSAAHPASGLLDTDESPVDIVIRDEFRLQSVAEIDAQLADAELVENLRLLEVCAVLRCFYRSVHSCKFLFCHGVRLLRKYFYYNTWNRRKKQAITARNHGNGTPGSPEICVLIGLLFDAIMNC